MCIFQKLIEAEVDSRKKGECYLNKRKKSLSKKIRKPKTIQHCSELELYFTVIINLSLVPISHHKCSF